MKITDTLLLMKEFILAPLLHPALFDQWLNSSAAQRYRNEVLAFSENFVKLLDDLDKKDEAQAQASGSDLSKIKSRRERWIDCLLGEEISDNLRVHGLVHDETAACRNFLNKPANAPIRKFLEENLHSLSFAALSCENTIYETIDFALPLAEAVKEVDKAREILVVYRKHRDVIKALQPETATIPDTTLHRNATLKLVDLQPASVTELQSLPVLSPKTVQQLHAQLAASGEKSYKFPVSCIHRLGKILPHQDFEKILPHLKQLFEAFEFLATCKYLENSKTLNNFYVYMLTHLKRKQECDYLGVVLDWLEKSLDKLISENKLVSVIEIKPFFAKNGRVRSYWANIYDCFIITDMPFHTDRCKSLERRIDHLLDPEQELERKIDALIARSQKQNAKHTPSPPMEDDTFHIHDSDSDTDLLEKLLENNAERKLVQRTNSDASKVIRSSGFFQQQPVKIKRVDSSPSMITFKSSASASNALIPPGVNECQIVAKRQKH